MRAALLKTIFVCGMVLAWMATGGAQAQARRSQYSGA